MKQIILSFMISILMIALVILILMIFMRIEIDASKIIFLLIFGIMQTFPIYILLFKIKRKSKEGADE